ncbi:MAG: DUF512 domain-containing protein, partial [Chloroflexia bacterium]
MDRTIDDLAALYPTVLSIAVVPVGLTKFRGGSVRAGGRHSRIIAAQRATPVRSFTPIEARGVVESIDRRRASFRRELGTNLVFASDEFYLEAGKSVPSAASYEGFHSSRTASAWCGTCSWARRRHSSDCPPGSRRRAG